MKRLPKWVAIEEMMQPGRLTRDGMLGDDPRPIEDMMDADSAAVEALGVTHEAIAARLRELTELARAGFGTPVTVGDLELVSLEARGGIPCPFKDAARGLKVTLYCTHTPSGETFAWSLLTLHMIEAHGFYEGQGSAYRVEPEKAVAYLGVERERQ